MWLAVEARTKNEVICESDTYLQADIIQEYY